MNKALLAWAAGFIDGEGTISMYRGNRGKSRADDYFIKLCAVNTYLPSLERLQLMFGGSIQSSRSKDCPYGQDWKPAFNWSLGPKATEVTLKLLRPYIFIKRSQLELALGARSLVKKQGCGPGYKRSQQEIKKAEHFIKKFRNLNKKGKG